MEIAEKFSEKIRKLNYPSMDQKLVNRIEDIAGKKNREAALENYKNELREEKQKYRDEVHKIEEEFKLALFEEYGVVNNPKAEKVFAMAWERGHSTGLNDVEIEFSELVELIK